MDEVIGMLESNFTSFEIKWNRATTGSCYRISINGGEAYFEGDYDGELIEKIRYFLDI